MVAIAGRGPRYHRSLHRMCTVARAPSERGDPMFSRVAFSWRWAGIECVAGAVHSRCCRLHGMGCSSRGAVASEYNQWSGVFR